MSGAEAQVTTGPGGEQGAAAGEGEGLEVRVTELIREVLFVEVPATDTDLIEDGLLDSLGLVSLITELEVELGFELPLDDLDVDNFRTVRAIAAFVRSTGQLTP